MEVTRLHPDAVMQRMGAHGHQFYEVLLITAGRGEIGIGGRSSAAEPGHLFVIPPGIGHDCRGLDAASGWAVLFLPDGGGAAGSGLGLIDDRAAGMVFDLYRQPFHALGVPVVLGGADLSHAEHLVARMAGELATRPIGYDLSVRAALQMLLVGIARHLPQASDTGAAGPRGRDLLAEVFRDIDAHFRDENSLAAASRRLGYTAGHLTTKLRVLTGRTYGDWVIERRMIEARRLLATTTLSLAEIAHALGYAEIESFARRFREHHGTTPAAWRRAAHRNPGQ